MYCINKHHGNFNHNHNDYPLLYKKAKWLAISLGRFLECQKCNIPVKRLLQDLTKRPFLHPCKILQDLAKSCEILRDFASCRNFVQDSCKIPQDLARSCRDARKRTFSCKILQERFYWDISCNTGTHALPDMSALALRCCTLMSCVHIRQCTLACVTTIICFLVVLL